jgi:hypothetical protein
VLFQLVHKLAKSLGHITYITNILRILCFCFLAKIECGDMGKHIFRKRIAACGDWNLMELVQDPRSGINWALIPVVIIRRAVLSWC